MFLEYEYISKHFLLLLQQWSVACRAAQQQIFHIKMSEGVLLAASLALFNHLYTLTLTQGPQRHQPPPFP